MNKLDNRCDLFGIQYVVTTLSQAQKYVVSHVKELSGKYICFSNVHTSVMAREHEDYRKVLNGAAFVFPDGNPIVRHQRRCGYKDAMRVAGPDFMRAVFNASRDGSVTHYFYGSKESTLEKLKRNLERDYPGIVIKGMFSPPFREISPREDEEYVKMINAAGADFVWVGLGAPKQEKWMKAHEGRINGVMMGVGAGFDFHAGTIRRAPVWIQKIGFEWLYRMFQDPRRLIRRYVVTNTKYAWYLMKSHREAKKG